MERKIVYHENPANIMSLVIDNEFIYFGMDNFSLLKVPNRTDLDDPPFEHVI